MMKVMDLINTSVNDLSKSKKVDSQGEKQEGNNDFSSIITSKISNNKKTEIKHNIVETSKDKLSDNKNIDKESKEELSIDEKDSDLDKVRNEDEIIKEVLDVEEADETYKIDESIMSLITLLSEFVTDDKELEVDFNIEDFNIDVTEINVNDNLGLEFTEGDILELISNSINALPEIVSNNVQVEFLKVNEFVGLISEIVNEKLPANEEVNTLLQELNKVMDTENINIEELQSLTKNLSEEILAVANENANLSNKTEVEINQKDVKFEGNDNKVNPIEDSEITEEELENGGDENQTYSKEEKILNSILKKDTNDLNFNNRFTVFNNVSNVENTNVASKIEINQQTMVKDIVQTVKYMSTEGINELIVKVNPRGLGELIITIVKDVDGMTAQIKASNKDTYSLILQNSEDLKKYLGEQNLKVENVDISLTKDATDDNSSLFGQAFKDENQEKSSGNIHFFGENLLDDKEEEFVEEQITNLNMLV